MWDTWWWPPKSQHKLTLHCAALGANSYAKTSASGTFFSLSLSLSEFVLKTWLCWLNTTRTRRGSIQRCCRRGLCRWIKVWSPKTLDTTKKLGLIMNTCCVKRVNVHVMQVVASCIALLDEKKYILKSYFYNHKWMVFVPNLHIFF
jgi:hypothetical protein